ncbi:MAG: dTDP-4-dehydrorhamnose 3,5-epimerase [Caulobacteraceae bacterium]|nr:dTDP-4-dehydrorhamnose 3,5-epimerase [Caulobacteraceae bacterium]
MKAIRHADDRGWFSETFSSSRMAALGLQTVFVQDNQSWSRRRGTVRGLHFQRPPSAQAKLVSCLRGRILDVVVDLRRGSPTFGQHLAVELEDNGDQIFVPEGFAHGFITLTDDVLLSYKVSRPYDPLLDDGIVWNDPDLAIDWPVAEVRPTLSERDKALPRLSGLQSPFDYGGGGPMCLISV